MSHFVRRLLLDFTAQDFESGVETESKVFVVPMYNP